MGRRDYSQSPPSRHQDYEYQQENMSSTRDQSRSTRYENDSYRQQYNHRRESGRTARDDDYSRMYDDEDRDRYRHDDESNRDWSHGQQDSRSRNRHDRSRSPDTTRDAGRPSDTVILEGLPFGVSPIELRECLLTQSIASEYPSIDVRISSSRGQRRGFIQFDSVDNASDFVKEHFPQLPISLRHSTDEVPEGKFDAYIHFARNRDEPTESRAAPTSGDWICSQCDRSNFPTRTKCRGCGSNQSGIHWRQSLTGAADAGENPSHILVVYPLAHFVNEDMLATDMKRLELDKPEKSKDTANGSAPKLKSTAPTNDASGYGARPGSLHRVFLMRDTETDESFKYGFAEFWTMEDAAAALTKFRMSRNFTVAACPVTISTIHMGVFVPQELEPTSDTEHLSFHPLFNPSLLVRYRDLHAYPSQQMVTQDPPGGINTTQKEDETNDGKKTKKRKADGSLTAAGATKKPVAMAGTMAIWQRKHDELRVEAEATAAAAAATMPKPRGGTGAIKISLSSANAMPIGATTAAAAPSQSSTTQNTTEAKQKAANLPAPVEEPVVVSYVDRDRLMCLICMRKYKSVEEVDIHEKSRNHKTATEDPSLVDAALPRLANRDKRLEKLGKDLEQSEYRDRAQERRKAFQQPKKPASGPRSSKDTAEVAAKVSEKETTVSKASVPSKGAGMLAKMGWSAGAGLGANGDGRTDVIATNAYQEGVGLGAEGGNLGDAAELAEKKTRGGTYAEYVNSVQDRARDRYNKLG